MQVTASRVELLLECQRPFDPTTPIDAEEPSEPMRYGSAWHACLQHLVEGKPLDGISSKWGIADEAALHQHAADAFAALQKWMLGTNPWGTAFHVVSTERPLATNVNDYSTRICDFDAETHTYDLRKGEIGGTADLVVESVSEHRVVIDYKSGDWGEFHAPASLPQMLTLALQTDADTVAILHHPRGAPPAIYSEDVSPQQIEAHVKRLRRARRRIGDGSLRPGPWCSRCPARSSCPAKDGELLVRASSLVKSSVGQLANPIDKGAFHMLLQELARLEKRAREVLRDEVRAGEIIVRPDGKVLVIKEKAYESLSKSSIVSALGKQKGEEMIAKLRKLGCVVSDVREELHAVEDR